MKIFALGKAVYITGMLVLAVVGILAGDFIYGRPPAWQFSGNVLLSILFNGLMIICCIGDYISSKSKMYAIGIVTLLFMINFCLRSFPDILHEGKEGILTHNGYKVLILMAGAICTAFNEFFSKNRNRSLMLCASMYSIFFLLAGRNHFKYDQFVFGFIPDYIPFHAFWTYFTGLALIAGGVGLFFNSIRSKAALLSVLMMSVFFVFLHLYRFITHNADLNERMGLDESLAFAGGLLMIYALQQEINYKSNSNNGL